MQPRRLKRTRLKKFSYKETLKLLATKNKDKDTITVAEFCDYAVNYDRKALADHFGVYKTFFSDFRTEKWQIGFGINSVFDLSEPTPAVAAALQKYGNYPLKDIH